MRFDVVRSQPDDSAIPHQLSPHSEMLNPTQVEVTQQVLLTRAGKRFRINGKEFDPNRVEIRPRLNSTETWEVFAEIYFLKVSFRVASKGSPIRYVAARCAATQHQRLQASY